MKFCPNCGTILALTHNEQDTTLRFCCPQCQYVEGDLLPQKPEVTSITNVYGSVVVVDKDLDLRTTSTERAECPKCHHTLAYVWQVQTRAADEGATQFYRCTQCGFTWRLYT